ncbi:MAG: hypothetical protein LBS15_01050 [Endomicrobium sp.]|nr:hypothetical protein [Endomicrobium sp.]
MFKPNFKYRWGKYEEIKKGTRASEIIFMAMEFDKEKREKFVKENVGFVIKNLVLSQNAYLTFQLTVKVVFLYNVEPRT